MKNKALALAVSIAVVLVAGTGIFLLTSCGDKAEVAEAPVEEPEPIINPLTGATEADGFDPEALDQRIVAVVVENTPDARPQWGMDDEQYSPDIILEGEVEGGITRTLWFYADFNKMPEQLGPMRSARPPYIRFSELFDAIFIHWGMSHSKGDYVGANTVFKEDVVDHINQMRFTNECGLYDRDHSRNVSGEHTGIIYGDKVRAAIQEYGCRWHPETPTKLTFNETPQPVSDTPATEIRLDYSARTDWDTTVWTYNTEDSQYHTDNFNNNLTRDNLLVLFDETEYITKSDYQGAGGSVTYCDYALGGGKGKLFSQGTVKDIEWDVYKKQLILIDADATAAAQAKADAEAKEKDEEPVKVKPVTISLNPGKTWIGWASNNNGGKLEVIGGEEGTSEVMGDSAGQEEDGSESAPGETFEGDAE